MHFVDVVERRWRYFLLYRDLSHANYRWNVAHDIANNRPFTSFTYSQSIRFIHVRCFCFCLPSTLSIWLLLIWHIPFRLILSTANNWHLVEAKKKYSSFFIKAKAILKYLKIRCSWLGVTANRTQQCNYIFFHVISLLLLLLLHLFHRTLPALRCNALIILSFANHYHKIWPINVERVYALNTYLTRIMVYNMLHLVSPVVEEWLRVCVCVCASGVWRRKTWP